ncbi:mRNA splicing factor rna helicase [Apiospora aurea]|uniref:mRNA splicing factor rna helicase n=1 Tax=Apiospora aurea TaxID=335848 RepID=A0ABR1QDH1_9PEZI
MNPDAPSEAAPETQVLFRGKKRKAHYRQRATDDDVQAPATEVSPNVGNADPAEGADTPSAAEQPTEPTQSEEQVAAAEEGVSVAELLRRRNARRSRLRGVGFAPKDAQGNDVPTSFADDLSLMIREEEQKAAVDVSAGGMSKRFSAQTGHVGELVNKHITDGAREDYIAAQLAKRHAPTSLESPSAAQSRSLEHANGSTHTVPKPEGHIAMQGKLLEVDLGDEVRNRNANMTERARRLLAGEKVDDEEPAGPPKKVRLGRDGKPWRPRNRRDSDAMKRDQLVEELMRENRREWFPLLCATQTSAKTNLLSPIKSTCTRRRKPPVASTSAEDTAAADDRIAEEFRREFMDAMAARQKRRKAPAPAAKPGAKKDEDVLRGPKLGGSRNTRAAMRDLLLKQEKEKR